MYPNPPYGCTSLLKFLIVDHEAKYGLIGDAISIALSAYVDGLYCRSDIIVVGMPW